jgi:hypothetical protein
VTAGERAAEGAHATTDRGPDQWAAARHCRDRGTAARSDQATRKRSVTSIVAATGETDRHGNQNEACRNAAPHDTFSFYVSCLLLMAIKGW